MASYKKRRIDQRIVEEGLAPSRARAADLVRRGNVTVGGVVTWKPGALVADDAVLAVTGEEADYVSRGGLKLVAALETFELSPKGRVALDVGASTGGFVDVLLARGAVKVYAVDVGRDQLHPCLRADPRVVSLESTDARKLDGTVIPDPVTVITADVSFISLTQVLPTAFKRAAANAWLVGLVKPQFEAGREAVGKGGIVRGDEDRIQAVERVRVFLEAQGWQVLGVIQSPIPGGSGNVEFLIGARRGV